MALNGSVAQRIRRHRQRTEQQQRGRRHALPLTVEPVLADAHHRAGQAEAQHREADHERAEMGPAADLEDSHDANLQRDHRAGLQADRQVERGRGAQIEISVARRTGPGSSSPRDGEFKHLVLHGKVSRTRSVIESSVGGGAPDDDTLKYVVLGAGGADAFTVNRLRSRAAEAPRRVSAPPDAPGRSAGLRTLCGDRFGCSSRVHARAAVTGRRPWRSGI